MRPEKAPGLIIVIPCHDEPDLLTTLKSLDACDKPDCPVQVRVVVNSARDAAADVRQRNLATLDIADQWLKERAAFEPIFILEHHPDLPAKHAGVGLARKIGMDAAAAVFKEAGYPDGPIVCLDADCTVEKNYLTALVEHFSLYPDTPGCSIHFEHPFAGLSPEHRLGIAAYELYLRYYRRGLVWAGHPAAFHTVGSSMAVRADVYGRQGGMNRRKAGEDFYFLQKIIPLGGFTEVTATRINPSPRRSLRVPFGTGRAMDEWLAGDMEGWLTYDPRVFRDLKAFFALCEPLYEGPVAVESEAMAAYLVAADFAAEIEKIRGNTASLKVWRKKFFHWFNLFRVLKFIHYATERHYPKIPLEEALSRLWSWKGEVVEEGVGIEEWLARLRRYESGSR